MDPYRTLGIPRGCTREEAKAAFRAMAWHMHPDRGGNERAFIEYDNAYKSILRELDSAPSKATANSVKFSGTNPPSRSFGASWDSEIIVLGTSPPVSRTPKAPDPDWAPEMTLLDQPPRPFKPFDPTWEPEMVVLDGSSPPVKTPEFHGEANFYDAWLQKSTDINKRGNSLGRSARTRVILTTIFLILTVVALRFIITFGAG